MSAIRHHSNRERNRSSISGMSFGEQSLDSLARLMAQGQARIVTEDKGRLIDRAWHATLRALRGLAGRPDAMGELGAAGA